MKLFKFVLLILVKVSIGSEAKEKSHFPRLQKGEKRFKKSQEYRLKDFNFVRKIKYFDVVSYAVDEDATGKPKVWSNNFGTVIYQADPSLSAKFSKKQKDALAWLKEAIIRDGYFWQYTISENPTIPDITTYISLRFIDEDSRLKAIETRQDIKDILGDIDTPAELSLWLYANHFLAKYKFIYSYKKINDLYRVRFYEDRYWQCLTLEYFVYYNDKGVEVKRSSVFSNVYSDPCQGSKER